MDPDCPWTLNDDDKLIPQLTILKELWSNNDFIKYRKHDSRKCYKYILSTGTHFDFNKASSCSAEIFLWIYLDL